MGRLSVFTTRTLPLIITQQEPLLNKFKCVLLCPRTTSRWHLLRQVSTMLHSGCDFCSANYLSQSICGVAINQRIQRVLCRAIHLQPSRPSPVDKPKVVSWARHALCNLRLRRGSSNTMLQVLCMHIDTFINQHVLQWS